MKLPFKKIVFSVILVIAPFAVWLSLEYAANKVTERFEPLRTNKDNGSLYLNQDYYNDFFLYKLPVFLTTSASNRAVHLEKKGHLRIFCLGGSTTAGYPYNTYPEYQCPASFPNYLRAILQYQDNVRNVEILNAGCDALNSYNVLQLFKDLKKYDPDVVVVYTGHNEYFGPNEFALPREKALQYYSHRFSSLMLRLRRTYLYQGLSKLIGLVSKQPAVSHQDFLAWSKVNHVPPDGSADERVEENFKHNVIELVQLAKASGIKVVLCTPVSNWTFPPFISEHRQDLTTVQQAAWDSLHTQALAFYDEQKYKEAISTWNEMKQIDSTYADLYYQSGKAYTRLEMHAEAAFELWRAKDYDALPFRAKSFISPIIRDIAREEDVVLADVEQFFIQMSGQLIPNTSYLLEHLHPTEAGYYYVALHVAEAMVNGNIFAGVREIKYPELDKCRQALNIVDYVVDRVEFDVANESYVAGLSDLNPEIKGFLTRLRNRAHEHAAKIGQELAREKVKEQESGQSTQP